MALINLLPPNLQKYPNIKALCDAFDASFQALPDYDDYFLYDIDNVDPAYLPWLARQFHVDGYNQANTEDDKRNLIKQATALHRYKGTPWVIKEILKAQGYKDVKIIENIDTSTFGNAYFGPQTEVGCKHDWALCRLILDAGENIEISESTHHKIIMILEQYKNLRTLLKDTTFRMKYDEPVTIDESLKTNVRLKSHEYYNGDFLTFGDCYFGESESTKFGSAYWGQVYFSGINHNGSGFGEEETHETKVVLHSEDDVSVNYICFGDPVFGDESMFGHSLNIITDQATRIDEIITPVIGQVYFGRPLYPDVDIPVFGLAVLGESPFCKDNCVQFGEIREEIVL